MLRHVKETSYVQRALQPDIPHRSRHDGRARSSVREDGARRRRVDRVAGPRKEPHLARRTAKCDYCEGDRRGRLRRFKTRFPRLQRGDAQREKTETGSRPRLREKGPSVEERRKKHR